MGIGLPEQACPGWKLYHGWVIRIELLKHVAAAVEFMHSVNVVHRDLTSYNLLVTDKWEAKVRARSLTPAHRPVYSAAIEVDPCRFTDLKSLLTECLRSEDP